MQIFSLIISTKYVLVCKEMTIKITPERPEKRRQVYFKMKQEVTRKTSQQWDICESPAFGTCTTSTGIRDRIGWDRKHNLEAKFKMMFCPLWCSVQV